MVNLLLPVVLGIAAPGVWRCDAMPNNAADLVQSRGWTAIEFDASAGQTKKELLQIIGAAGKFPSYFGHNWDAVADCFQDLSWLDPSGIVVLARNGGELAACCPDSTEILLDVLAEASEVWSARGIPFTTVWEGDAPESLPSLDQLP